MENVIRLGRRVMVQQRTVADQAGGRLTEVVGVVVAATAGELRMVDRLGRVAVVPVADIARIHQVPPARTGTGPAHLAVGIDDLERVSHDGWRPTDEASLGQWVLRASAGVTGRANSALALGDPGMTTADAVAAVRHWYGARGLPAMIQLAGPVGFDPAAHPLGQVAMRLGMVERVRVLDMTADRAAVVAAGAGHPAPDGCVVSVEADLSADWLAAYVRSKESPGSPDPDRDAAARQLLTSAPAQSFPLVRDRDGAVAGIGRVATSPGWAGLFGLWTTDRWRRRNVATALLTAGLAALPNSVRAVYLQVTASNLPAVQAYRRLGFVDHHEYVCLMDRPA